MKKIFIIVCLFALGTSARAKCLQRDTAYKSIPGLHRFDGTWEYADNNTTFRIILKSEKIYTNFYNSYIDLVSGYHLYIKDGKTIQNSIGNKKTLTYGFYLEKEVSKNVLSLVFNDLGRSLSADAIIELLPNGTLKWTLRNGERITVTVKGWPTPKEADHNLYVPTNLILKKVK